MNECGGEKKGESKRTLVAPHPTQSDPEQSQHIDIYIHRTYTSCFVQCRYDFKKPNHTHIHNVNEIVTKAATFKPNLSAILSD